MKFSKDVYTPVEVAYMTGVKVETVYRWIRTGKLKVPLYGFLALMQNEIGSIPAFIVLISV